MTIFVSRELPLFNFKLLDILCGWIRLPFEKLWPFEFLESFGCSISSVSIYYALESDFRVTSYDHLNFTRAFVVQFRASQYIMRLNRTSVWQVMTIWFSRELSLFNFELLDVLCAWIGLSCDKLWTFEFLESIRCSIWSVSIYYVPESDLCVISYDNFSFSRASVVQFPASRYIMGLNRTSVWQVMTIWISRELPVFNSEHLDKWCARIGVACENLWPSGYIMCLNQTSVWQVMTIWISRHHTLFNFERLDILSAWIRRPCDKLWPFEFLESFRCSISSFSIYYAPESDFRVKSYDHCNFSRAVDV